MLGILLVLLTQVPCAPEELATAVCMCKQGSATACEALRQTDAALADRLEAAAHVVAKVEEERQAAEAAKAHVEPFSDSGEPPDCKGQNHHIISKRIAKALEDHLTLRGLYKARDSRFVSRAADEPSHCGYQHWHRDIDDEVIRWLESRTKATPKQFEAFLREIYSRPEMRLRFPNGF